MINQVRWVERSFHFDFPVSLFPVIFSRLEGSIFRLKCILTNADDELCSRNLDGWSVKEQLGHLCDLEDLWWKRLEDFVNNRPILTAADTNNPATHAANHNAKSIEHLLHNFTVERQKMLETIYGFENEILEKTSVHARLNMPMRLIDLLFFIAEHDDHHIAVISAVLRK
jgi:uncharacterized damage-inducible protein DinB